jgi:hypothetical protein
MTMTDAEREPFVFATPADRELAIAWVETLERGDVPQGKTVLRTVTASGETFDCCLGRLCDLADPTAWKSTPFPEKHDEVSLPWGELCDYTTPPGDLVAKFGMSENGTPFNTTCFWVFGPDNREFTSLAYANDAGVSHPEIAKELRRYFGFPAEGPIS